MIEKGHFGWIETSEKHRCIASAQTTSIYRCQQDVGSKRSASVNVIGSTSRNRSKAPSSEAVITPDMSELKFKDIRGPSQSMT